ncbi:MAG TPA: tetratricopeptide repeat protein [Petrimonas sp.]|uniref:tetratricopeptide repeat protein n=1 Tax=Petrimonas sp. TaxID=2023866 RepID=UPI0017602651|nr:tetratricopeptide repeat protein [Petrimonas sp.]
MKKSHLSVLIFFLFPCLNAWSQVEKGVELFLLDYFDEAKETFEQSASRDPDLSYYFLGEIALRKSNSKEAAIYFEKGISADAGAVYCRIGKTKLDLKSNPEEFKKSIKDIANKNKKKAPVLLAAAQAYLHNNMPGEAEAMLSMARNADKAYPYIYIFEGDRLKEKGEAGEAATQYEQAINFDPKCAVAYIKKSMVYESISPTAAINTLVSGLEANPNNILIGRYLARSYYKNGFYKQAIAEYEKLNRNEVLQSEDLRNYAASLYFAEKYNEALATLTRIISNEPDHPVVNRLLMYTQDKLKNYDAVVTIGRKFFSLPADGNNVNYLASDYTVWANALIAKGQIDEAIEAYKKAVDADAAGETLCKEIAVKLAGIDKTADAADFYQKYIETASNKDAFDYLQLGIYYYRTASDFSAKTAAAEKVQTGAGGNATALKESTVQYVSKANAAFAKVIELAPDNYQGYYWRANANTLLDPDLSKGLANEDYSKTIEMLVVSGDKDNQSKLIEAYRYFSIYYLYRFDANKQAGDKNKAKEYADKVLQLKPDDETSLKIVEILKK